MTTSNVMKKTSLACAGTVFVALGTLGMGQAQAVVVTFDDLPAASIPISNGYQGLNWNSFNSIKGSTSGVTGFANGTVSPSNVAYNSGASIASASIGSGTFNFTSAYLTGGVNPVNILVQGLLNNVVTNTTTLSSVGFTSPTLLTANWTGIDTVRFTPTVANSNGIGSANFALDNFTYSPTQPVPEPLTILGSLTGGSFLLGLSRKYKNLKASAKA